MLNIFKSTPAVLVYPFNMKMPSGSDETAAQVNLRSHFSAKLFPCLFSLRLLTAARTSCGLLSQS